MTLKALIEAALDAGRDPRPGRAQRADGWTPERIRIFLEALARGAGVTAAAAQAGMTARSAYRLCRRADAFRLAWDAALQSARRPAAGPIQSRALHGFVEPIIRHGKVWGERHRFDNRHTMAVLTRLDRSIAANPYNRAEVRIVAENFEEFLDIVCSGDTKAAADFIEARRQAGRLWQP
jgi:hypothetical protein